MPVKTGDLMVAKKQENVGIPVPLLKKADELVKRGDFNSRAAVAAFALRKYIEEREGQLGIVLGED